MEGKQYCYHCRAYHPKQVMRPVMTRAGQRWRCLRSLAAAARAPAERDAFGRLISAANRAEAERYAHGAMRRSAEYHRSIT